MTGGEPFRLRIARPESMRQKDEQALRILQEAFPDRKIVGITNREDINILGGGIHCISRQIPKTTYNNTFDGVTIYAVLA